MPLRLTRDDVMKVLEMSDCVEATEKAFTELAAGTAVQPLRISMTTAGGWQYIWQHISR